MPALKLLSVTAALALLTFAGQASAHAKLIASAPAANATVAAPQVIRLSFNENLVPAFSSFDLTKADGAKIAVKTSVSSDRKTVTGALTTKLTPGIYKIAWHAAAAGDGHRMEGIVSFTVK